MLKGNVRDMRSAHTRLSVAAGPLRGKDEVISGDSRVPCLGMAGLASPHTCASERRGRWRPDLCLYQWETRRVSPIYHAQSVQVAGPRGEPEFVQT